MTTNSFGHSNSDLIECQCGWRGTHGEIMAKIEQGMMARCPRCTCPNTMRYLRPDEVRAITEKIEQANRMNEMANRIGATALADIIDRATISSDESIVSKASLVNMLANHFCNVDNRRKVSKFDLDAFLNKTNGR